MLYEGEALMSQRRHVSAFYVDRCEGLGKVTFKTERKSIMQSVHKQQQKKKAKKSQSRSCSADHVLYVVITPQSWRKNTVIFPLNMIRKIMCESL